MAQIFTDENHSCQIDFSKALWATDQLNTIFHQAKLSILGDVDFVAETDDAILFVEYKNANIVGAANPAGFQPLADKKLNNVARKYYDSYNYLQALKGNFAKKRKYIYILECVNGDSVLRNRVRVLLAARLPFLLQRQQQLQIHMIDSLDVLSIDEWNQMYPNFPLHRL